MRLPAQLIVGWFCFTVVIALCAAEEAREIADALHRASDIVLKARKASELDVSLIELCRLADAPERFRSGAPERESSVKRLHDAAHFLQQWQNYLWAVEGEKFSNAIRTLTDLAQAEQGPLDVPRSEILARARSLESKDKAQVDSYAAPILQSIHSLDDLPTALTQLRSGTHPPYQSRVLSNLVNGLDAVCKAYLAFKEGVATTLPPTYWQTGDSNLIVTRLRAELLLLVLPRILGVEQTDGPKAGETVERYLMRMRATAIAHRDFELLGRTISAAREISSSIAGPGQSLIGQDYTSFLYWREGQNAERAKRFFEAALAYRRALSSATPAVPVEFIGERLDAIEKEHPGEFIQATDLIRRYDGRDVTPRSYGTPGGLTIPAVSPSPTPLRTPSLTASPMPSQNGHLFFCNFATPGKNLGLGAGGFGFLNVAIAIVKE